MSTYPVAGGFAQAPARPATDVPTQAEAGGDADASGARAGAPSSFIAIASLSHARSVRQAQAAPIQAPSRAPRGAAKTKCASGSPFRECRGGEALVENAWTCYPFDQYRYASASHIGACAGWVREAMRRVDRSDSAAPQDLTEVAHQMSLDATRRRRGVAQAQFSRVNAFQFNAASLGLLRYRLRGTEHFNRGLTRTDNINAMIDSLGNALRENEMAFVRLALSPRRSRELEYGHALLVQRLPHDEYTIFDPNTGAFLYQNRKLMQDSLRAYMDEAFDEPELGLEVMPYSVQFFERSATALAEQPLPQSTPLLGPPVHVLPGTVSSTHELYDASADEANELSSEVLSAAAGERRRRPSASQALAYYALRNVARGRVPDLTEAIEDIRERLIDRARRPDAIQEISRMETENRYAVLGDLPNRTRRPGRARTNTVEGLLADLRLHFGGSHDPENASLPYRNDFAELRLTFRSAGDSERGSASAAVEGYSIVVQRRGQAGGFEQDGYDLYEPELGVFRYTSFAELSQALQGVMERGYPEYRGIDHVDTVYFGHSDDVASSPHSVPAAPEPHESRATNLLLGSVEPLLGVTGNPSRTPALTNLTAQPDFGFDEPPATLPGADAASEHDELKRSPNFAQDRKPFALFRPSTITPAELAEQGGFECDHTRLRNINLDMHNFDVASNPFLVDSAGYLGTFRQERKAAARLPSTATSGFIYFVAPTPNMVDVNSSLGSQARAPENSEVAAMGRIDYTQIRGWRVVTNGVAGRFVPNPVYRWDVYNQTRTAGGQPLLSRFPVTNGVWRDSSYSPFVLRNTNGDARQFNQDIDRFHAAFYDNAWEKVRELQARQAMGLDYRGPLTVEAYGASGTQGTHLHIDQYGSPVVASRYKMSSLNPASRHRFTLGDDGRLHLADDYQKVLRVGSDGYVYLGGIPSNLNSTNGVFEYSGSNLIHREDGKFLTVGKTVYTPYVTRTAEGVRSVWALHRPDQRPAKPPRNNEYTFAGQTMGRRLLYLFEADPDEALPETATHFVTTVPGNSYRGNFLDYADIIRTDDARAASKWLREHDAAWLFRDGLYVTARGSSDLEARTLDGSLRWWTEFDSRPGAFPFHQSDLSSSYRIGDDVWERVRSRENRHEKLLGLLG